MANNLSKKFDSDVSDGGHKTHTTALVLMVLFTGLVLTIALGDTSSLGQSEQTTNVSTSTEISEANQPVGSSQVAAVSDLFSNIPVEPDVEVTNEIITRGGEPVEQVISYKTTRRNGDLRETYRDWLEANNYTILKERIGNYAASYAATNGDSAVIVLISYLSDEDMSRVEIINYQR